MLINLNAFPKYAYFAYICTNQIHIDTMIKKTEQTAISFFCWRYFSKWLRDKDLEKAFKDNFETEQGGHFNIYRYMFERCGWPMQIEEFVNYAFTWSDTPEGHRFWKAVNDEWVARGCVELIETVDTLVSVACGCKNADIP